MRLHAKIPVVALLVVRLSGSRPLDFVLGRRLRIDDRRIPVSVPERKPMPLSVRWAFHTREDRSVSLVPLQQVAK